MVTQLYEHLQRNSLFEMFQSAFRAHHTTEKALVKVTGSGFYAGFLFIQYVGHEVPQGSETWGDKAVSETPNSRHKVLDAGFYPSCIWPMARYTLECSSRGSMWTFGGLDRCSMVPLCGSEGVLAHILTTRTPSMLFFLHQTNKLITHNATPTCQRPVLASEDKIGIGTLLNPWLPKINWHNIWALNGHWCYANKGNL